jgi:hypothetical protein
MFALTFVNIVLVTWNHSSGKDLMEERNGKGDEMMGCGGRVRGRYMKGIVNLLWPSQVVSIKRGGGRRNVSAHSLFRRFPKRQFAPFALDNDPYEIAALRADIQSVGVRDIVRGRQRAHVTVIREHLG